MAIVFFYCYEQTSAVIFGWYSSQIWCEKRRRMIGAGWKSQCKYSSLLTRGDRGIHAAIFSRFVLAAPGGSYQNEPPVCIVSKDGTQNSNFLKLYGSGLVPVNDEHSGGKRSGNNLADKVTAATQVSSIPRNG